MTVLTKTKPRQRLPKCPETTTRGTRCKFNGIQYVDGKFVCRRHSRGRQ